MKLPNTHQSMANHHESLGGSVFLKRSRHYYDNQYSRHTSTNHTNASSSRDKGIFSYDDIFLFKLTS